MAALATIAQLKSWLEPSLDSSSDTLLQRLVDAAEDWIERATGHVINKSTLTRRFSGRDAEGAGRDTLHLPFSHWPVLHTGSDLVTVSEDGTSLTLATGYSTTADVVLRNTGVEEPCSIIRNGVPWSTAAPENIVVAYKTGWTTSDVPADVLQLEIVVAGMMFRERTWLGKASIAKGGVSMTYEKELDVFSLATLSRLRGL